MVPGAGSVLGSEGRPHHLHVMMFPWFAFGHISPFIQLSNKISSLGVQVSFLSAPGNIPRILSSLNTPVKVVPVQIPAVDGLSQGIESTAEMPSEMAELLINATDKMEPQIEALLVQLRPQIVFIDFATPWVPSIAHKLGIKTVFFSVFSAISGAFLMNPVRLVNGRAPTLEDMKKAPTGLGHKTVQEVPTYQACDFLNVFKKFDGPPLFDRVVSGMQSSSALLIKSCLEMEEPCIKFLEAQYQKPVLLAGPVVPEPPSGKLENRWAKWLSNFPERSVILCSFGSETFLNEAQIRELAWGLEISELPFILVLNFPKTDMSEEEVARKVKEALPEGFQEKVKDRGIVHSGWIQQTLIMSHQSVGCFLGHAGWSSVIEALVNNCQLVLLPLRGDQYLNSKLVAWDLKAGIEVRRNDEDGHFGRDDVCQALKIVTGEGEDGKSIRANHKKWREFLCNKEIQERFTIDLVEKLKELVSGDSVS